MEISEIMYHDYVILQKESSVSEALHILVKQCLEYGVIEDYGRVLGYVTLNSLSKQKKDLPVYKCFKTFKGEISWDTIIDKIGDILEWPVLLYDKEGQHKGIVDSTMVFKSLKCLYQRNKEQIMELNTIINLSSDEIYVTDAEGVTLMVNKAFEENSSISREEVMGKSVDELEKKGIFRPSVVKMVLEQKKQISILQRYNNDKQVLVTANPVFGKDGSIFRVIVNARDTSKLNKLKAQLEEVESLKERYYNELIDLRKEQFKAEHIIAKSKVMSEVLNMACKVADVDSTVLLLGETGVGKNLLARFIHDNSSRRDNAFISINCGAIPENLLESELFGYESGAFTGAHHKGKKGKIELAHQGTFFLDEIGDLPFSLQGKLLNVLHEGILTRIGSNKEIKIDVRFLAATNHDLANMIKEKLFREDLYYRLNVVPLEIPPLQVRHEDIIPISQKFLDHFNKKYHKNKRLSAITENFLLNYHWPGNIRELKNIIERLVIIVNEENIQPYHLPEAIKNSVLSEDQKTTEFIGITSLQRLKDDLEKTILNRLYQQYRNTYKIAQILKVNQSTIVRKLKKYNIK